MDGLLIVAQDVCLIGCNDLRTRRDLFIVSLKLLVDGVDIRYRITAFRGCSVYNMDQYAGTLDMAQELMSQTYALGSTLNQSRNIRDDEARAPCKSTTPRFGFRVVK